MQYRLLVAIASLGFFLFAFNAQAQQDAGLVRQFLTTVTPPGARITLGAVESTDQGIVAREIVVHGESAAGEEFVQRVGSLHLQGLRLRPDGLFAVDGLSAENLQINAEADVKLASLVASSIDGVRIGSVALSGARIVIGAGYTIVADSLKLKNIDATALSAAARGVQASENPARLEDALISALLNSNIYSSINAAGVKVSKAGAALFTAAAFGATPDGSYVPFPASGNMFARQVNLNLRDPMFAEIYKALGQDELLFDFNSQHAFNAPGKHRWDTTMKLAPDGALNSTCLADNLSGFSPAIIRQAQAASTSSAILRRCDISFTGTEFVNRWLAQDGAKNGLTADQARGKYLAVALYAPFDPQLAADPMAVELAKATQIFLSQPARLNIQIAPQGGLKFPEGLITFAMLFQDAPEVRQKAAQQLGISITATPLVAR